MKIATWNCAQALNRKLALVQELGVDICVVPEAEHTLYNLLPTEDFVWQGMNNSKGIGVYAVGLSLKIAAAHANPLWYYFVPITVDQDRFRILAVWAFNGRTKKFGADATGEPSAVLPMLSGWLSEKPAFVADDFNNSVVWDKAGKATNFHRVHEWLREHGFASAYHTYFQEALGKKRYPTHYHRKSAAGSFHIDYLYTNRPESIERVEVGRPSRWLEFSDHFPIVVNIKDDV